jgi:hypothetical protein
LHWYNAFFKFSDAAKGQFRQFNDSIFFVDAQCLCVHRNSTTQQQTHTHKILIILNSREIPKSFDNAMEDIKENRTVTLDKALNKKPSFDWKEAHDMQQKLVINYVLENEKLKDEIKLLKTK